MKKKLLYIATLLIAMVGFASCSDDMATPPLTYPEQAGNGTGADPYNVGAALVKIYSGQYTTRQVYVKGIISSIETSAFDAAYGNITFYMSDDGKTTNELEVYRCLSFGGTKFSSVTDLAVGDEVVIVCRLTLYNNSVAETQQGATVVSLNGSEYEYAEPVEPVGDGQLDTPYNVTAALDWLFDNNITTSSEAVYVKGIISKIDNIDTGYGNATYYISDSGTSFEELEIYRGYSLGGAKFTSTTEIKVGDEVIVYGKPYLFSGSVPEFNSGSQIYSLNGVTAGTIPGGGGSTAEPKGDGTVDSPYNCAMANKICADGTYTDSEVYVEGIVSSVKEISTDFGNATYYISDDGTATGQFEIFRGYYLNGDKFTSTDQLKAGDKVIVLGKLTNYNGTYEMTQGNKIYSLNGKTSSGGDDPSGPTEDETIYSGLSANADGWTFDNVILPAGFDYIFNWNTSYNCLYATAYKSDGALESEAYAYVTVDLSAYKTASLSFEQAAKFQTTLQTLCGPVVREAGTSTWTKLTVPTWCEAGSWTFVPTGDISLDAYAGKKIEVGLVYASSTAGADSWEIKNFVITGSK